MIVRAHLDELLERERSSYRDLHANRNVLLTPFHNVALMCPVTADDDADRRLAGFSRAAGELVGASSS
jgi:hypothetical protein